MSRPLCLRVWEEPYLRRTLEHYCSRPRPHEGEHRCSCGAVLVPCAVEPPPEGGPPDDPR